MSELNTHPNPPKTVPDDSNGTIELAAGRESQPEFHLFASRQRFLRLNENANGTDICPASGNLFCAPFEESIVDQFDPFEPAVGTGIHGAPE